MLLVIEGIVNLIKAPLDFPGELFLFAGEGEDFRLLEEEEKKELERRIDGLRASDLRPAFDRLYRYLMGPSKLASFTHNAQLPETARPQRGAIVFGAQCQPRAGDRAPRDA